MAIKTSFYSGTGATAEEQYMVQQEVAAAAASAISADSSKVAAASSATAASNSATAALSSKNDAANSAASILNSEANSATSASAAATSATNAAASEAGVDADRVAAEAAASAASTSQTNASTSQTNAATSQTNAATSATNASNSASNASSSASSASTNASNAATSASNASTSETNAATSATNAATSETNASTSETNAATSETNAATSATASAYSAASIVGDVADAQSAATQAQGYRDTASLHKLAAEAAATSATSTASALTGFDLAAIAETKSVTAVDVFVYDTSKDSDGGAWRKRTQGTSWYNEALNTATRGSRKEFPAVAVIVAESNKVTIYDGDDPAMPMWLEIDKGTSNNTAWSQSISIIGVTNNSSITSINAGQGYVYVGKSYSSDANNRAYGLFVLDFAKDSSDVYAGGGKRSWPSNIAARNLSLKWSKADTNLALVDGRINDVATVVLPNAPIDAATGLPRVTVAVATNGGVSVIKDDGTVVDITGHAQALQWVRFIANEEIVTHWNYGDALGVYDIPTADITYTGEKRRYVPVTTGGPHLHPVGGQSSYTHSVDGVLGSGSGLILYNEDKSNKLNTMVACVTPDYNTGWMNGDIKLATLSDTDDTDLVGAELATASGQSGTITDVSTPWASVESHGQASIATDVITWTGTTTWESLRRDMSMVAGKSYVVELDVVRTSGSLVVFQDHSDIVISISATGSYNITLSPTGASANGIQFSSSTFVGTVELISVRLAEPDRSVNDNGLQVHGTVTKTPVATGADLVGYSGFSSSNYLEQPYNSDLDFGTGDFSIMYWVYNSTTNADTHLECTEADGSRQNGFWVLGGITPYLRTFNGGGQSSFISDPRATLPLGWSHVAFNVTDSGTKVTMFVNGVDTGTDTNNGRSIDAVTTRILRVGVRVDGTYSVAGSMALLRISATAPTASQITKIYNDEKVLFQENAQATLYGTSDAVTALAHDDTTDLLHVGTSSGRSVFQGLRRVENTTDAVGTAISASNGLVVEE